ncbi:hypothetical protein, partial [Tolypothrix sp. FACHB-123]|uniref:hypothetical protein n=1 Tax=Tolypothrix sp. FACHB-123 TaxID=2692868 RepID=UPI001A7EB1EF
PLCFSAKLLESALDQDGWLKHQARRFETSELITMVESVLLDFDCKMRFPKKHHHNWYYS